MKMEKELYTVNDVIDLFQISRMTIYRWRKSGLLKGTRIKRKVYFTAEELSKVLDDNKIENF